MFTVTFVGIDPSQLQLQTATTNIINSSQSQSAAEQELNNLSSVIESEPLDESFSSIVSDTETVQIAVRHERQSLEYSRSLCVPYTDAQDEEDGMVTNISAMHYKRMFL